MREAKLENRFSDDEKGLVELVDAERGDGNGDVWAVALVAVVNVEPEKERFDETVGELGVAGASEAASDVLFP